jgi:hypothetical protein
MARIWLSEQLHQANYPKVVECFEHPNRCRLRNNSKQCNAKNHSFVHIWPLSSLPINSIYLRSPLPYCLHQNGRLDELLGTRWIFFLPSNKFICMLFLSHMWSPYIAYNEVVYTDILSFTLQDRRKVWGQAPSNLLPYFRYCSHPRSHQKGPAVSAHIECFEADATLSSEIYV